MESTGGITAYNARYWMPGTSAPSTLYWSLDVGFVHWVMLAGYGSSVDAGSPQVAWLEADLKAVDRTVTPWVFVAFHQPYVNSNANHQGDGDPIQASMEAIFNTYDVDVIFSGHVHAYERSCRMYKLKCTGTASGAIYITIGDGGNREGLATKWLTQPAWSLFRLASYGHGELLVANSTAVQWQWHQNPDLEPKIADSVWIVKGASSEVGPGVTAYTRRKDGKPVVSQA